MCEYCKKTDQEFLIEDDKNSYYACLINPTPISQRKHNGDGRIGTLKVVVGDLHEVEIPIAYCPICGRKLT